MIAHSRESPGSYWDTPEFQKIVAQKPPVFTSYYRLRNDFYLRLPQLATHHIDVRKIHDHLEAIIDQITGLHVFIKIKIEQMKESKNEMCLYPYSDVPFEEMYTSRFLEAYVRALRIPELKQKP